MIVGDDDQSIYGWRGAKVENIHKFNRDFNGARTIRLEQNYRSTGVILQAANALISNNAGRLGKNLWTDGKQGDLISLYAAFNDIDEARFIVNRIRDWLSQGNTRSEVAILYRSNAQSRLLEETLIQMGIPYRIYGGLRFFERAEVKDALCYLRLIANRHDDAAFERVVNTPTRGIGDQTVSSIRQYAREHNIPLWQASQTLINENALPNRAANSLNTFIQLIDDLAYATKDCSLGEMTERVIHGSGLFEHHRKEKGEKGQARIENLEELINATREFSPTEDQGLSPLLAFLSHAALEAGENQADAYSDCVQLMTLHTAKGLEFPLVFLCGMEEGLFPHQMSSAEPNRLEEERRLCYVGMTRAMRKLYLTYAECRRQHGSEVYHRPSRFIQEIPEELIEEIRVQARVTRPVQFTRQAIRQTTRQIQGQAANMPFRLGQRVSHPKFGEGTVLSCEGQGAQTRVQVKFRDGSKWLVMAYARLEAV
jgi:DNA helicase-2/ATP-dependent DNA helicase PcrA